MICRWFAVARQAKVTLVMHQAVVFASPCPHCEREQVQDRFTVPDLMRLLYSGYAIEAYCGDCDEFWPVSLQKRVELGEVVAATCAGELPLEVRGRLIQHRSED
jgi:hypothetical protein